MPYSNFWQVLEVITGYKVARWVDKDPLQIVDLVKVNNINTNTQMITIFVHLLKSRGSDCKTMSMAVYFFIQMSCVDYVQHDQASSIFMIPSFFNSPTEDKLSETAGGRSRSGDPGHDYVE